ncbi:MAG: hypothetical protein KC776_36200 [Myxococcales bacterium]|nr:hypothetical protein [Myxococcales bacterium]MCB9583112.1 hypothetical protein [Polyangiaceae bacterium]
METHPLLGPPYTWCDDQCIPCPLSAHCPKRKRLGMVELLRESLDYPEGSEWLAEVWRVFEELCPEDRMPKVLAEREAAMGGEFCKAADALSDAASRVWDQAMKEDDLPWQIQSLCLACERFVEAVRLYLKNLEDAAAGREAVWGPVFLLGRLNRACEDAEMDALATDVDFDEICNARGRLSSMLRGLRDTMPPEVLDALAALLAEARAPSPFLSPRRRLAGPRRV